MRLPGIGYTSLPLAIASIARNTMRKLPIITTDARTLIVDHLMGMELHSSSCHIRILDGSLTPIQKALDTCLKTICEESLYLIVKHCRYICTPGLQQPSKLIGPIQVLEL